MNRINFSLVLLIVLQFVALNQGHGLPDVVKAHAKKLHDMCQKQHNIQKEVVQQSLVGEFSEDLNFKCYIHCLFDKVGLIDDKNIIHLEHLNEVFPEELHYIINGLVASCGTKAGADGCETAFNTMKCYKESNPELFAEVSTVIV